MESQNLLSLKNKKKTWKIIHIQKVNELEKSRKRVQKKYNNSNTRK